jgi:hypothetical protein
MLIRCWLATPIALALSSTMASAQYYEPAPVPQYYAPPVAYQYYAPPVAYQYRPQVAYPYYYAPRVAYYGPYVRYYWGNPVRRFWTRQERSHY